MANFQAPHRYITGLPTRAQEEIRRNFDEVTAVFGRAPSAFVVVDSFGRGDYTSIKDAIEASPSLTVVYVIPGTYTDAGRGRVVLAASKKITVLNFPAETNGPATGFTSPQETTWTFDGFTNGDSVVLRIVGIGMKATSGNTAMWAGGGLSASVVFENSAVNSDFRVLQGTTGGSFYGIDSTFDRFVGNGVSASWSRVYLWNCKTTCAGTTSTITVGGMAVEGGVFGGGGVTLTSSAPFGNQATRLAFMAVEFSISSTSIAANNWAEVTVQACRTNIQTGTGTSTLLGFTVDPLDTESHAHFSANFFPGVPLVVRTASVNGSSSVYISGAYQSIETNVRRTLIDAQLWKGGAFALQFESGADECLANITIGEESGSNYIIGVEFQSGADNNIVIAQGLSDATTPISDSGTGNSVNALPPSGAAGGDLSGSYPNPSVVDDSHAHTASTLPSSVVYDGDAAGGDLSGAYPNPGVVDDSHAHTEGTVTQAQVVVGGLAGAGYVELSEQSSTPSAPASDVARLFVQDDGGGKTQLVVRFPTGAVQVIATEP